MKTTKITFKGTELKSGDSVYLIDAKGNKIMLEENGNKIPFTIKSVKPIFLIIAMVMMFIACKKETIENPVDNQKVTAISSIDGIYGWNFFHADSFIFHLNSGIALVEHATPSSKAIYKENVKYTVKGTSDDFTLQFINLFTNQNTTFTSCYFDKKENIHGIYDGGAKQLKTILYKIQ
jgi:hypothetical protein